MGFLVDLDCKQAALERRTAQKQKSRPENRAAF
jgi:hypothetical protein